MKQRIIGRELEQRLIKSCLSSDKAELIAVYGRRRIGKTYLIKQALSDDIDFYVTGIFEGSKTRQLAEFNQALYRYSGIMYPIANNWRDAFMQLRQFIAGIKKNKVVIFIDELPWFDTVKSGFKQEFDYFWNSWGADQPNLKLIVCGSSTTWMTSKLIGDRGGLHNRVTRQIYLAPFSLGETEEYLTWRGFKWNRYTIVELYMILGGVPYYLSLLDKSLTMSQNIDLLFFAMNGELRNEYGFLFKSLFRNSKIYEDVIGVLCKKNKGMTRSDLLKVLKISDGGSITEVLNNLTSCDFIRPYYAFGKKERDKIYQLIDHYTLFYNKFVKGNISYKKDFWSTISSLPEHSAWTGYAFEQVCLHHIDQIREKLGIKGVISDICSWTGKDENMKGQIDLVIDRKDQIINLCEMKYSVKEYEITKEYMKKLLLRKDLFEKITKTKKAIHLTMVSTYGIKQNEYSEIIQNEVTMDDLFKKTY